MQKMRYLTGESDIIKNITGKTYGKDLLSTVDIDKLHQSSLKQFRYHTGSKSAIGRITGMALYYASDRTHWPQPQAIGYSKMGKIMPTQAILKRFLF